MKKETHPINRSKRKDFPANSKSNDNQMVLMGLIVLIVLLTAFVLSQNKSAPQIQESIGRPAFAKPLGVAPNTPTIPNPILIERERSPGNE